MERIFIAAIYSAIACIFHKTDLFDGRFCIVDVDRPTSWVPTNSDVGWLIQ